MLSAQAFSRAKTFLLTEARPLEAARFRHEFEGDAPSGVVAELKRFQNDDGGFGHGIEPDLRTSDSSALGTTVALQILQTLPDDASAAMRSRSIDWLVATYNDGDMPWRIIPPSAQSSPHAPWWDQADGGSSFDQFSLNPTAEILGHLIDAGGDRTARVIEAVAPRVVDAILGAETLEMHDLLGCLRLLRTRTQLPEIHGRIRGKLHQIALSGVARETEAWSGYCLRPLQVVDSPDSELAAALGDALSRNLEYEISTMTAEGTWEPPWSWGEMFPEAWPQARREWQGVLTLEKLDILRRFGAIEFPN